jgi:uncharacterized protein (UPF0332 family)
VDLDRSLLEQAEVLSTLDANRPKQVNLRRAVSAAYYAVFHLLVREATGLVIGRAGGQTASVLRAKVSRWFTHDQVKATCLAFAGGGGKPLPPKFVEVLGSPPPGIVPAGLVRLADTFVSLQGERHDADYDVAYAPTQQNVLLAVQRAKRAIDDAAALVGDPVYNLFLAMLLTGEKVVVTR